MSQGLSIEEFSANSDVTDTVMYLFQNVQQIQMSQIQLRLCFRLLIGLPYYLIIWAVILEVSRVLVASETLSMDTRIAWQVEFDLSTHKLVSLTITCIVAHHFA